MHTMEGHGESGPLDPAIIEEGLELAISQVKGLPSRPFPVDEEEQKIFLASPQSREILAYHNVEHTKGVVKKFVEIIQFLKHEGVQVGSDREIQVGILGAAFHDTVQTPIITTSVEPEVGVDNQPNPFAGCEKRVRGRVEETSEKPSAEGAILYMRECNKKKPGTFTARDEDLIRSQIKMTVAKFDPKTGTVIQPNLDQNSMSSVIERALALADLGSAGMDTPEQFVADGAALFREDNIDIYDALYAQKEGKEISEKNKEYYKNRMLVFSQSQPTFARGRQQLFDREVKYFPKNVQEKLKAELFNSFESSIRAANEALARRGVMSFEELVVDMGYSL